MSFFLKQSLPTKWQHYIDHLSEYMASTGREYKSHLATIRRWVADEWYARLQLQVGRELMKNELENVFDSIAASAVLAQEDSL